MTTPASGTIQQIENRYYASVPALTTQNSDYIIPNGSTLTLSMLGGNGVTGAAVISPCQIIWDALNNLGGGPQVIFGTYTAGFQYTSMQFTGDGVTVLRISLTNNDAVNARVLGAYYSGTQVTP